MNTYGWVFLFSSWAVIIGLLVSCFGKVFTEKDEEI